MSPYLGLKVLEEKGQQAELKSSFAYLEWGQWDIYQRFPGIPSTSVVGGGVGHPVY